ncbi:energy transducer TonB [Methylovorus sp. MM2]|uniref:energy transducer TonB n=1 Tax=Methylovorus sp. MM2 TaxID=1848038 RepID=UPI0007DF1D9C|nr:energy transducer TonB [Methylovorus sp. MM2]OAM51489.1 energy transducer TonB [Methylovorus sp. MM2]
MSSVLNQRLSSGLSPSLDFSGEAFTPVKQALAKTIYSATDLFESYKHRQVEGEVKTAGLKKRDYAVLIGLVVVTHFAGVEGYLRSSSEPIAPPKKNEVIVEFVKPVVVPPQPIEPPKPLPQKLEAKPQPAKPVSALRTPPAETVTPQDVTVHENTTAQKTSEPVAAVPTPPPAPPAPKEEPVTEASGYAGYLNNPAPEYPAFAQRQGWEGKVILRVRVLANGKPGTIELKESSGRKTLDEAALEVVKGWVFAPAKRGSTPVDGWATVPIEFRLSR